MKEKKQKLKDSEMDLQRRHEQMKKSLEQQVSFLWFGPLRWNADPLSSPKEWEMSEMSDLSPAFLPFQAKELEEKIRAFDLEKVAWDEEQREMEPSLRRKSLESNASKE